MSVVGIIPAGGSGERLGADRPKAFVVCAGRRLLDWSVDVLAEVCERVVVAVPPGYEDGPDRVTGGASRSASVRNALAAAPEATVAVVHDAARPLVTRELVERCLAALEGVDGAIAAVPVTDTIHALDADEVIASTPPRSALWAAQTPQVFRAAAAAPRAGGGRGGAGARHRRRRPGGGRRRTGAGGRGAGGQREGHHVRRPERG